MANKNPKADLSVEPWLDRQRAHRMSFEGDVVCASRRASGAKEYALLDPCEAFELVWGGLADFKGTKRWSKDIVPAFGDKPSLLVWDESLGVSRFFTLGQSFLCHDEDVLLASRAAGAWIRAWTAGARRVDLMGFERCSPPADLNWQELCPRNTRQTVETLMTLVLSGALDFGAAKRFVEACEPLAAAGGHALAALFAVEERALIEAACGEISAKANMANACRL